MKNLAASVRARLLNLAKAEGRDYNRLSLLYLQERFLARLGLSSYRDQFILKGGLYLYSRYGVVSRPTRDMDLLGRGIGNDLETIQNVLREVLTIELEDGVVFDADSVQTQRIKEGADYEAVRASFVGTLGSLRQRLSLDVSFGDKLSNPQTLEYPTLLELTDAPSPTLLTYDIETVIAEKLQAMTFLGPQNSRAKDFYDLFYASRTERLDATKLRLTIQATFSRRNTPLDDVLRVLEPAFAEHNYLKQAWAAFYKNNPALDVPETFAEVISSLTTFLGPVIENTAEGEWQPDDGVWQA